MRILCTILLLCGAACSTTAGSRPSAPAATGPAADSLQRGSDPRAVSIAEEVLDALGGAEAWDRARVLEWNFFGRRSHVWDKWTGDYRLDEGTKVVLMNLGTGQGRLFEGSKEITDSEAKTKELARAKSVWINDSYWLVMPYKLLDPGVTLHDVGQRELPDGSPADVIALTFEGVGNTPRNKYEVFVSQKDRRVEQWAYFQDRDDAEPKFTSPWTGWHEVGGILLSGGRGQERELTAIAVHEVPPVKLKQP